MSDTSQELTPTVEATQDVVESPAVPAVEGAAVAAAPDGQVDPLQKQISELRKEAAKWRTKVREFEKLQEEAQAELERKKPLEEKLITYEQKLAELQDERDRLEALSIEADLRSDLADAGVAREFLQDALTLYVNVVQASEEGEEPGLEEFLKARPYLTTTKPQAAPLPGANPAGKTMGANLSRQDISRMTPDEYKQHRTRIMQQMAKGGIR